MMLEIMLFILILEGIIALIPMIVILWGWMFDELHRVGDNKKPVPTKHKRNNMYIPKGTVDNMYVSKGSTRVL